ncbi:MAG: asparagine synthetase B [Candidatus Hydrothermota bacterium]|nr:MAG: asparagine synthetase B [Candidatus Hydrothermae bacterium]
MISKFLFHVVTSLYLLIPMDNTQQDHLRAYGVVYNSLAKGIKAEWILNFRGGSFLIEDNKVTRRLCDIMGVSYEKINEEDVVILKEKTKKSNIEFILLEKAPRIAVYAPPYYEPWDDAVMLALDYAQVKYTRIYDDEVLQGELKNFDWLHLHHEDFTGQFGKFYGRYRKAPWYRRRVEFKRNIARKWGFRNVPELEHEIARRIKDFVENGGFLFAMCSAPITLDIALASEGVDIQDIPFDGTPPDPYCNSKLDYSQTLAFKNFSVYTSPVVYEHSDIDVTLEAARRGENTFFVLQEFSAKIDPIPAILTQNHTRFIKEFLGQDTGFRMNKLKKTVIILARVPETDEVKYLYGDYGKGFFTFLGGHDPEDFKHYIGDPPTDLRKHKHSPGYRLILNNILLPAAKRKKLKT